MSAALSKGKKMTTLEKVRKDLRQLTTSRKWIGAPTRQPRVTTMNSTGTEEVAAISNDKPFSNESRTVAKASYDHLRAHTSTITTTGIYCIKPVRLQF